MKLVTQMLFFGLVVCTQLYAQKKTQAYQSVIDRAISQGIPGIVAMVIVNDSNSWFGTAGYKDIENKTPLDLKDSFRTASITKLFTTILVLQLEQENRIDLNDSITKYFDDEIYSNIPNAEEITILHLLSHSSGIYSFTENNKFWKEAFLNKGLSRKWLPEELIAFITSKKPINAPVKPFSSRFYSNTNYILLGMIIEKVTNNRFDFELKKRIFDPLNMKSTFLEGFLPSKKPIDSYAIPKWRFLKLGASRNKMSKISKDGLINISSEYSLFNSWAWAAGGIASNTKDLALFLKAIKQGTLINSKSMNLFSKLYKAKLNEMTFYGGTGGSEGIQATMLNIMPFNIDIIVLINSTGQKNIDLEIIFNQLLTIAKEID